MAGPANAVVGDQDSPFNVPEVQVPEEALVEEKKMAKYSRTEEFRRLEGFINERIAYFQRYFPSGQRVQDIPAEERAAYWQAACIVVTEFQGILDSYEAARQTVKDNER